MDIILYWNAVALDANREAHTVQNGEQRGPTLSARALGIVHLAMHDAFFAIEGGHAPYMSLPENPPGTAVDPGTNTVAAVSAAACTALSALYPSQRPKFEAALMGFDIPAAGAAVSNAFGRAVARRMIAKLMIKAGDPGVSDLGYEASFAHARHRQDPCPVAVLVAGAPGRAEARRRAQERLDHASKLLLGPARGYDDITKIILKSTKLCLIIGAMQSN